MELPSPFAREISVHQRPLAVSSTALRLGNSQMRLCYAWLFICCYLACALGAGKAAPIKVGVAQVKITPGVGTPMATGFRPVMNSGVLDDLYVRAAVIEDGGKRVAFVTVDLAVTTELMVTETRRLVRERTGILETDVMITASHTHRGPVLTGRGLMSTLTGGDTPYIQ